MLHQSWKVAQIWSTFLSVSVQILVAMRVPYLDALFPLVEILQGCLHMKIKWIMIVSFLSIAWC